MTCGPTLPDGSSQQPSAQTEPFSFSMTGHVAQGMTAWAAMWCAPWRAVAIVAEEAMRGPGSRDD